MVLAHCPSVLQLPGCSKLSLPGAGEVRLCCQTTLPCVSQPREMLNVWFQSPVFLQEDNFIIKKDNCGKGERLILHFFILSQKLKLRSRAKWSTSLLRNLETEICDTPQSFRKEVGYLELFSCPSTSFVHKQRHSDSCPKTLWVGIGLRWSMGMSFILELSASSWTWWQSSSFAVQG